MKIEEFEHFGKDIINIQENTKIPFRKKINIIVPVLSFITSVIKALGVRGKSRFR